MRVHPISALPSTPARQEVKQNQSRPSDSRQPCACVQGRAGADHTTLLLNCYTKLKDVAKLDAFLRGSGAAEGGAAALPFDIETAVKVPYLAHSHSAAWPSLPLVTWALGR